MIIVITIIIIYTSAHTACMFVCLTINQRQKNTTRQLFLKLEIDDVIITFGDDSNFQDTLLCSARDGDGDVFVRICESIVSSENWYFFLCVVKPTFISPCDDQHEWTTYINIDIEIYLILTLKQTHIEHIYDT